MGREAVADTAGANGGLAGSTVLLTGASGFLGKAVLATLLARADRPDRLFVLLRASDAGAARRRLEDEVLASDAFATLSKDALRSDLDRERLLAVAGDLESDRLDAASSQHWGAVDTVIHCAASVSFEDPLDEILALNSLGPLRLLESLHDAGADPHFVHVSTAYAADCRRNSVGEDGPEHAGLAGLDPDAMLATAREWRSAVEEESRGPGPARRFAREGERDAAHRPELDATERAEEHRRRWAQAQLGRRGRRWAMEAGWQDAYALTKALGERLLKERDAPITIVRPTIIESALRLPQPGWLEGIKVADPLILAYAARGLTHLPGRETNLIDIVPVDYVANACVAAAAYPPAASESPRTIAVASSAHNPLTLGELAAQIRIHFKDDPLRRRDGTPIVIGDLRFVDRKLALRRTMRREALARVAARAAGSRAVPLSRERQLRRTAKLAAQVTRMVKIYGPYTELNCVFEDGNGRALAAAMSPADRAALPFDPADIEWEDYLQRVHLPSVHRMSGAGS
ncbi:MAG: SDR family oxidoreductase [Solirubrobacterales bacterium]